MIESESENDYQEFPNTPEVADATSTACLPLLPEKSRLRYIREYSSFVLWCKQERIEKVTEEALLIYFTEKSEKMKSSTLWSLYSKLKTSMIIEDNVDISKFSKLLAFLKKKSVGYRAKKSLVFTRDEITRFLLEAPDELFLMMKVALILGVAGGCRREELTKLTVDDIKEKNAVLVVNIPDIKTQIPRSFTLTNEGEDCLTIFKKYAALRPPMIDNRRFFVVYRKGKCVSQPVGVNTFGKIPQKIAQFLRLPNPSGYTGHCFRRTSAALLSNSGAGIFCLKRYGGWKPSAVGEGYVDNCVQNKVLNIREIPGKPTCSTSTSLTVLPPIQPKMNSTALTTDCNSFNSSLADEINIKQEFPIYNCSTAFIEEDPLELPLRNYKRERSSESSSVDSDILNLKEEWKPNASSSPSPTFSSSSKLDDLASQVPSPSGKCTKCKIYKHIIRNLQKKLHARRSAI